MGFTSGKSIREVDQEVRVLAEKPDPIRVVKVMMEFHFKDTRLLPLSDLLDYISYRLNLSCGSSYLVKLHQVSVLTDDIMEDVK